jgi:hypothetical protein
MLRSQGKVHQAACGDAARVAAVMYGKFIRRRHGDPQKWFATKCGLKKFNPGAVTVNVTIADIADCEKRFAAAINRSYSERLDRGSDGKGNFKNGRGFLPYAAGSLVAASLIAFLFFSQSVFSISFGRFGEEYRFSFPKLAEGLWNLSGLVRGSDMETHSGSAPARNKQADNE